MNEMFSQGGKGSTGILTNKQAVARHFGVKQSEVVYFSVGALLTGYKVIYDKATQRAYSLPADIGSGVTAVSLSTAGVLVHSAGNVDLGALAVTREEYVTLPGSFDTGVTVNAKNELVVFTDGKYRWDGEFPKVVPAGSTPDSTGEVKQGAWVSVGDASLRGDLEKPTGAGVIGVAPGRTQADKNSDVICVLDEGAKADSTTGLDGTDSTAAFLSAIAKCKSTGKALSIPKGLAGYRLTQTINVRGIAVLDSDATLYINHAGIGVIFGGNASVPNNPRQCFGSVIRVTGVASRTNPDMRGIGVKGQNIHVERCDFWQLYADNSPAVFATDYSSAYSMFFLKKVDTVELYSAPGTKGWINENTFHLNRTNKILFADGLYSHNHNKFHDGTMEGLGLIDLPIGNNNYFYGLRFERVPSQPSEILTINLGLQTWNNAIETTWLSSPRYSNEPYTPNAAQVVITDLGKGNAIHHAQDNLTDEASVFALTDTTPFVSYANAGLVGFFTQNTDMHGVRYVQHLIDGRFKLTTNFAPVLMDDRKISVRNGDMFSIHSDATLFRPCIFLYDTEGNWIQNEPTDVDMLSMPGKTWNADGYYTLSGNIARMSLRIGLGVSAIRIQMNTGNNVAGQTFKFLRITARFYKNATNGNRKIFGIPPVIRKNAMSYFSAADINMANIAEGLPCYKNDMTEMKINHLRQRYIVKSVAGNVITVAGSSVQYFDQTTSAYVAYTSGTDNAMAQVSAVSGQTITLVSAVPAEIVAGSPIDFLVTKTKALA